MRTPILALAVTAALFSSPLHATEPRRFRSELASLQSPSALGGGSEAGNGGDAVVCRRDDTTSVEILDIYEAREMREIPFDLGAKDLPVEQKLEIAISRLDSINPSRARRYRAHAAEFLREAKFLKGVDLTDIPDSQHVALPRGCWIQQIAIQREPQFPEDKRYIVSKDLWDRLDNDNRASLILHEIIYRDALSAGAKNSIGVRYFNSYLTSGRIATLSLDAYADLVTAVPLPDFDARGLVIAICRPGPYGAPFDPCGVREKPSFELGQLISGFVKPKWALDPQAKQTVTVAGQEIEVMGPISFWKNGMPMELNPAQPGTIQINGMKLDYGHSKINGELCDRYWQCIYGEDGQERLHYLQFFKNGDLKQIETDTRVTLSIRGGTISCTGVLSWHSNGRIETCSFGNSALLKTPFYEIKVQGNAVFDINGRLIEADHVEGEAKVEEQWTQIKQLWMYIHENDEILSNVTTLEEVQTRIGNQTIVLSPGKLFIGIDGKNRVYQADFNYGEAQIALHKGKTAFFKNIAINHDYLVEGTLSRDATLYDWNGALKIFPKDGILEFTPDGMVLHCYVNTPNGQAAEACEVRQ